MFVKEAGNRIINSVQHMDASGTFTWEGSGVRIPGDSQAHMMVSDGKGGVIVTWSSGRTSRIDGLWGQRIDKNGDFLWDEPAVLIHKRKGGEYPGWLQMKKTITDGKGGAIITWQRLESPYPVYAQKISGSGQLQWNISGVQIAESAPKRYYMNAFSDERGGEFVVLDNDEHIQINRLDKSANLIKKDYWFDGMYSLPYIVADKEGGLVVALGDYHSITLAQFDDNGTLLYGVDGATELDMVNPKYQVGDVMITPDNIHGAYITWKEFDTTFPPSGGHGYYVQKVDANGNFSWKTPVAFVAFDENLRIYDSTIFQDDSLGILFKRWSSDNTSTIALQKVDPTGSLIWGKTGLNIGRDYLSLERIDTLMNTDGKWYVFSQESDINNREITMYMDVVTADGSIEVSKPILHFSLDRLEFLTTNISEKKLTDTAWFWIVIGFSAVAIILIGTLVFKKYAGNPRSRQV